MQTIRGSMEQLNTKLFVCPLDNLSPDSPQRIFKNPNKPIILELVLLATQAKFNRTITNKQSGLGQKAHKYSETIYLQA